LSSQPDIERNEKVCPPPKPYFYMIGVSFHGIPSFIVGKLEVRNSLALTILHQHH
jgi:hypothetical protein